MLILLQHDTKRLPRIWTLLVWVVIRPVILAKRLLRVKVAYPPIVSLRAELDADSIYFRGSKMPVPSNSSVYSFQYETSSVEPRRSPSLESDRETIMSSYVEAQIDNTIQWIESYTYSPEMIETVVLPVEERKCTGGNAATVPAPDEHDTYNNEGIDTVLSSRATYRETVETINSLMLPIAQHAYTATSPHPTTPPTRKPSKLSKKRPLSPSASTPSHNLCPLELSNLKRHLDSRETGWVKSPKPTNLGFADIGYSTRY